MDSFEISKFAGGILAALLAIVLPPTLAETFGKHAAYDAHSGYTLKPAPAKAGGAPAAAAAAAVPIFDTVKPLLATAKPDAGSFKVCSACHSNEKTGTNKAGPALWGIVGRPVGSKDGFPYSEGMKTKGGEWTYDRLAAFINNPKTYVPNTKMTFAGLSDPEKLAEMLAYLGTLSDAPVPLPK